MEISKNDLKILELKAVIEQKKLECKLEKKFIPITNCLIEIDNVKYNLHVLQKDELVLLLLKLNSLILSAENLGYLKVNVSGYLLTEWVIDIKNKIEMLNMKDKKLQLTKLEKRLSELLSNDVQIELEIGEIENMLK